MLGKLQNCGFMRYRTERRGRNGFDAFASSSEQRQNRSPVSPANSRKIGSVEDKLSSIAWSLYH